MLWGGFLVDNKVKLPLVPEEKACHLLTEVELQVVASGSGGIAPPVLHPSTVESRTEELFTGPGGGSSHERDWIEALTS